MIALILAAAISYDATVIRVIDGDTLKVHIAGFPAPFDPISIRVYGIDTPEHERPPAQTVCEVKLGIDAALYARTVVKPGDHVMANWQPGWRDKYGRLLATVTLPDKRDFGAIMIAHGSARPYGADGDLHKGRWCVDPKPSGP